jgi:hypothetical protein
VRQKRIVVLAGVGASMTDCAGVGASMTDCAAVAGGAPDCAAVAGGAPEADGVLAADGAPMTDGAAAADSAPVPMTEDRRRKAAKLSLLVSRTQMEEAVVKNSPFKSLEEAERFCCIGTRLSHASDGSQLFEVPLPAEMQGKGRPALPGCPMTLRRANIWCQLLDREDWEASLKPGGSRLVWDPKLESDAQLVTIDPLDA